MIGRANVKDVQEIDMGWGGRTPDRIGSHSFVSFVRRRQVEGPGQGPGMRERKGLAPRARGLA